MKLVRKFRNISKKNDAVMKHICMMTQKWIYMENKFVYYNAKIKRNVKVNFIMTVVMMT